jgi:hypothetical protein
MWLLYSKLGPCHPIQMISSVSASACCRHRPPSDLSVRERHSDNTGRDARRRRACCMLQKRFETSYKLTELHRSTILYAVISHILHTVFSVYQQISITQPLQDVATHLDNSRSQPGRSTIGLLSEP